jgi:hypothetical protein
VGQISPRNSPSGRQKTGSNFETQFLQKQNQFEIVACSQPDDRIESFLKGKIESLLKRNRICTPLIQWWAPQDSNLTVMNGRL